MRVLLVVFSCALVLLIVLSTLGGTIRSSEQFFDANGVETQTAQAAATKSDGPTRPAQSSLYPAMMTAPSTAAAAPPPTAAAVTFALPHTGGKDMKVVEPFGDQEEDDLFARF